MGGGYSSVKTSEQPWGRGAKMSSGELRLQTQGVIDLMNRNLERFPDLSAAPRLEYIETLNLASNKLTVVQERDFDVLPSLIQLDLSNNKLTTFPNLNFLQFLEEVDLKKNLLEELPPYLKDMPSLATLNVSGNRLKVIPAEIGECRALRHLDISDNDLHALPLEIAHLNLAKGGFEWSLNPKMTFPPAEVRQLGQQGMMDWLRKQAEIQHPVVRQKKQALERIRKRETAVWLAQMPACDGWNTQEEYEEQLLRKPTWMDMEEAQSTIATNRMGGGWWPDADYVPPAMAVPCGDSAEGAAPSVVSVAAISAEIPEKAECTICMNAAVSCVFLPCGHAVACRSCATAVVERGPCPACRQPIGQVMNLFWT